MDSVAAGKAPQRPRPVPLTDKAIKALKPKERPYKRGDGRGLFLLVLPNGSKLWRYKYRLHRREKLLSLGAYPDVSLEHARDQLQEMRSQRARKLDPSAMRQEEKLAARQTFGLVAEDWLAVHSKEVSEATLAKTKWLLEDYLLPGLQHKPIASITPAELLRVLKKAEAEGAHETAKRLRQRASSVFRYAVATGRGGCHRDPTVDLRGALVIAKSKKHPAITAPAAVGALLRALDDYKGQSGVMYALRLAPHVFVRPGELRAAEWAEFDLAAKQWRIPGSRMKMGREHIVPLSTQVVAILEELKAHTGRFKFLFPALGRTDKCISENTLNAALRRMGYDTKTEMTSHGFRSTASTLLNERGTAPDLVELQLAHQERNNVRRAYNAAERIADRTAMMQSWSDYLGELRAAKPEKTT
jgi:integrase